MKNELIIKAYILLVLESLADPKVTDSRDIVKEALDGITLRKKIQMGIGGKPPIEQLLEHVIRLVNKEDEISSRDYVIGTVKLIFGEGKILQTVSYMLDPDKTHEAIKSQILSLRNYITNTIKRNKLQQMVRSAYRQLSADSDNIKHNPSEIATTLINQLEGIASSGTDDDPAVISRINFENKNTIKEAVVKSREENSGGRILKLGWECLNEMLQGGIKLGTFNTVAALQHNYKSGFGRSLFAQMVTCNDALETEDNKKPLALYISFEDPIQYTTSFLHQYFRFADNRTIEGIDNISEDDVTDYLYEKLTARGWYIDMIHVNPSEWGYRNILNLVLEYEVKGYEVKIMVVDYLSKLPTVGCDKSGAMGTDYQDMFRRVKNYVMSKDIAFVTPHQLNTEAKSLWASQLRGHELLDAVVGGGYYAKSKQLDVEIDLELYLALERKGDNSYLCVQRGKHRGAGIIPDKLKRIILPFPEAAPIPPDTKEFKVGGRSYTELNNTALI